jgi:hypothetical protein
MSTDNLQATVRGIDGSNQGEVTLPGLFAERPR